MLQPSNRATREAARPFPSTTKNSVASRSRKAANVARPGKHTTVRRKHWLSFIANVTPFVCRFDCPDLFDHDNSKCYFKNQTLMPGEILENFSHSDTCQSKCYCNLHRGGGPSEIVCNFQRCVEKLPHGQKVGRCLKQYDHEHCCPIKSVCGKCGK